MLPLHPPCAEGPCTAEVLISRLNKSPTASAPMKGIDVFLSTPWISTGIWMHIAFFVQNSGMLAVSRA